MTQISAQLKAAELHITLQKKLFKSYDTVLKYLFPKNLKNYYFVAIYVNIVFPNSPSKFLHVSTISVAKHSIKGVGLFFLICFGNKLRDYFK